MNVEQYKAAVIRKLAEMVKRKNYEPDGLDFGTEIFKKLDIDKMKASFFDEFAEFINSDEVTFSLEFSITPKNNFFAKIKMK